MENSEKRNQKIRSVIIITFSGITVGFLFTVFAFGFDTVRAIKGITAGFLITFFIGIFENFVFQKQFRKLKFSMGLFIRTLVYAAVISFSVILVWVIHESSINDANIFTTLSSNDFKYFIIKGDFKNILFFAIIVSFLNNLFMQVNNLLGKKVLLNYATGKYFKAIEEERAFMFLDLTSSTSIAESLGPVKYHDFIKSCFFDIDESIVESKGEIYQYVGDEVVISWRDEKGFDDCNCVKCFFRIKEKLESRAKSYLSGYGVIPEFKAGLHCGHIVTGEVGDSKREIVFHGDVLNTASRIQAQCNILHSVFLVSDDVLKKVTLPFNYESESLGKFMLRGKAQEVELFNVRIKE